ncbi:MAG: isopentenyl-diphosphate Delta-isomerase [Erysipelotrichaceae bacterium]|nr:isopentenyl-diphosphate Delta-isomerase [Erysipelotrichaceae bacterium]
MLRNEVVLVDVNDNEIRSETKENAHKQPLLHRAFSVFIYNSNNEILVQKRAAHKYHSSNLWANACCSHPKQKEDVKESANERLKDEVGIETEIEELFSFTYLNKFNDNLYEYEYDHVFLGKYDGEIILNEEEASETKWISLDELEQDLTFNPLKYASWFIICAPKVIQHLKNHSTSDLI